MSDTISSSAELVAPSPPLFDETPSRWPGSWPATPAAPVSRTPRIFGMWLTWCAEHRLNVLDAQRPHLELWARDMEEHQLLA